MKILIGTVNFHTKPFTEMWLKTLDDNASVLIEGEKEFKVDGQEIDEEHTIKVIVVNNSPEDDLSNLEKLYPHVTFINNKENVGVAAAWNQIIKKGFDNEGNTLYDWYVPANNDIYFTREWVCNFAECLKQDKKNEYGWVSSFLNDYKEPDRTKVIETVQLEQMYWSMRPEADEVDSVEQMESVLTAAYKRFGGIDKFSQDLANKYGVKLKEMHPKAPLFALSAKCLKTVGLFDEYGSPEGLHEDADYCKRIKEFSDLKIGAAFGAYAHHFSMMSRTKGEYKKQWWVDKREENYTKKWGETSKGEKKGERIVRLDIGSGYGPKGPEHWYHMEIDKKFGDIEYLHDVSKDLPMDDETFDEIYASNVLEHVSHLDVPAVLFNWISKLKSGGKIEIRVPNIKWIAEQYAAGRWVLSFTPGTELNAMHAIFGGDNPGVPHIHKAGFDPQNLQGLLEDCGMENITNTSDPGSWELRMTATKP